MTKIKEARKAKRLAVACAVILLLTFVVREVLWNSVKEKHDSLAAELAKYQDGESRGYLSLQNLTIEQRMETLQAETTKQSHGDFSIPIADTTAIAVQVEAELNDRFDHLSHLIDLLQSPQLRNMREQLRAAVENTEKTANEELAPKPQHDAYHFAQVTAAEVTMMLQAISVVILGSSAEKTAQQVLDFEERLLRAYTIAFYFLGIVGAALGIYAAATGLESRRP